jgi:hypothetical protein
MTSYNILRPSFDFQKVVHPKMHIQGMWGSCVSNMVEIVRALFEICSGNDMTSFDLLLTFVALQEGRVPQKAHLGHVRIMCE